MREAYRRWRQKGLMLRNKDYMAGAAVVVICTYGFAVVVALIYIILNFFKII